ncbi:Gfo/Idh/MocA family oxidoreductase [Paenibacillus barcinonensis]|uniref:Gfo/Idh/MocA family protein n=1 Tax=Paenibacillus barcinonensis TaxID=198119 RepID=UPI001C0FEBFD|nr:Gfo/Idh/MocA family oxidoreductase [Paenibacillus barcinonensis]MBU5352805.1 Gfo/Idh/MocA family oxidoreductase [Paenibacillus barcinonensis]
MTLQIGIIGTGWFSKVHADIITRMKGVRVASVCGTTLEKAEAMGSVYDAAGYEQLEQMLDGEKLDAVYICVPPMSHGSIEAELIKRGIPFLVEKPLSTGMDIPLRIVEQVQQSSLLTSVGYHFRYQESVQVMKQAMQEQKVGMALGRWMGGMPGVGWWRRQEGSGGQFVEQTTHIVDLLRFCAGEVTEVYAVAAQRSMHEKHEHVTVADVANVTLKLKSGAIASIANTCLLPDGEGGAGLQFYTDAGVWDWTPERLLVPDAASHPMAGLEVAAGHNPYERENEAFIHALRTGDRSRILSDYADACRTQEITTAAQASVESGLPVQLQSSSHAAR